MALKAYKVRIPKSWKKQGEGINLSNLVRDELSKFLSSDKNKALGMVFACPDWKIEECYRTTVKIMPEDKERIDKYGLRFSRFVRAVIYRHTWTH